MSTTGKEYRLAIRIAGIVDKSFTTSLASTKSALKAIDNDFKTLDKGFDKIMSAGKTCFKAIATAAGVAATAIGAATAASISVGSEFESAFAGVKKTVDATEEEYEQLRQSILGMAGEIPAAATEIAQVMEIAGQLGIAKDSLADFTETMINMGVSTNLSSEEAATNLAKFANIMNMDNYGKDGISNYERLGSTIVDLGNNFATTEAEIVDIATQLASAGELAGMSEADIMGISAAMSSVGLTAEAGASSMSRLIMQMQQSVSEGGDALTQYAETAGMTAEDFATLFRDDAAGAVVSFIEGLNAAGEDSYGILDDLELSTIRTRKAFLSLAGAEDLMGGAVDMANGAWDENTALAIEAAKRYETAESKVQLMKNAFSELGIVAYDELREPFVNTVEDITDGVGDLTEYVGSADGISKWMRDLGKELPTLQRKVKKYGGDLLDFLDPFLNIGEWFLRNPDVITSTLAGIGNALVVYKTASNLSHLATAIKSLGGLNPITKGVLVFTAAVGALSIAISAYKKYKQNLIDENLASHFGDIALSMEELQAVAEHIIDSNKLAGVKEALSAFDDLGAISSEIDASVETLNKMNWKVSIGMKLSEDEQETYQTTIEEYVKSAQAYAEQSQYAVSLNLKVLLGDSEDGETQSAVEKVNQFYANQSEELTALGKQLNDAVTEAFNDGLLDIKEAEKIAEIQAEMAKIQEGLATGEFDAQLSLLRTEYTAGGGLTADSFQNLQAELNEQVAAATETYKESYVKAVASINATNEAGELTATEYQAAIDSAEQEYMQNIADLQAKALNFQLETIMQQYADELDPAIAAYMESIQQTLTEYQSQDWENGPIVSIWDSMLQQVGESSTLDSTTKGAISQLLEGLAPTVEQMEGTKKQFEDMGAEIPESILSGMSSFNLLSALTAENGFMSNFSAEEFSAIGTVIGEQMVAGGTFDSFYQNVINQLSEQDYYIPESVSSGISTAAADLAATEITAAGEAAVPPAVDGVYALSNSTIASVFAKGFTASADLNITLNPKLTNLTAVSQYVNSQTANLNPNVPINQRAKGGLATSPELTWFAEEGPEMAIPIDGSRNAISLWEQTGRLLGMDSVLDGVVLDGGGSNATIQYNPTLQFYGEAPSKADITDALRISQDEFESLMARYLKTQGRVSFG